MPRPIDTAPRDGTKVTVHWTDRDGRESTSIAQYRLAAQLRRAGGDWDQADEGWWTYVDSDTQIRIDPHGWSTPEDLENE